ncbi:MAG: hypothetical protein OCD76_11950 [Reichenbachiella sp.]
MKKVLAFLLLGFIIISCDEVEDIGSGKTVNLEIPEAFTVDIPDELSTSERNSSTRVLEDATISGEDIYHGVRGFIKLGEGSAEILEEIMKVAVIASAVDADEFTYVSEDDFREKTFLFTENVNHAGVEYEFEMLVTDEDGSSAIQVFWSLNPMQGKAVLSPYNLDRIGNEEVPDALFQIDYEENLDKSVQQMTVHIVGLAEEDEINNMKMKVIKTGDIVEVFGNANLPNFEIVGFLDKADRNYAFRARADETTNIAVAEVALPLSSVTTNDMMEEYSVYNVFDRAIEIQLEKLEVDISQATIDAWLANTQPPGYFNEVDGFLGAGNMPEGKGFTAEFSDLSDLSAYAPKDVADMKLSFFE